MRRRTPWRDLSAPRTRGGFALGHVTAEMALHLLNDFDIPFGSGRGGDKSSDDDHTLWSTISILADHHDAIRGFDDPATYVVDLETTDFTRGEPRQVPLPTGGFTAMTI